MIEQYDAKADKQIRDTVAVLRRRRSAHVIPFSTWARSVSYFNQRVPTRVWKDQQRGLRIGWYRSFEPYLSPIILGTFTTDARWQLRVKPL